jgi:phosphoglycolate phosphatase-like HAD superfamily hydrolase
MEAKKMKLMCFDFDGTLVDSGESSYRATTAIFEHYRVGDIPSKQAFLDGSVGDYLQFYRNHGIPKTVTREEINGIWITYFQNHPNEPKLRDGVTETLEKFYNLGIKLAIVSGNVPSVIAKTIERTSIARFFNHIEADALEKVDELRNTLNRFSVLPHEAIYVDDTAKGVGAAKTIGMIAIGILGGSNSETTIRAAGPDYIAQTFRDLAKIIIPRSQ